LTWILRELGDELFIPDLSRAVEARSRVRKRNARREAFALLAPLLNLPDRDAVFARMWKRRMTYFTALATVLVSIMLGWIWTRTDRYQVREVAITSSAIVTSAESFAANRLLEQHAYYQLGYAAVQQARMIPDQEFRALALAGVARGLARSGQREQAGAVAQEAGPGARHIRDARLRAVALAALATAFAEAGDTLPARDSAAEAWKSALAVPNPQLRAGALEEVGEVLLARNDLNNAAICGRQLLEDARQTGDAAQRAYGVGSAAAILYRARDPLAAATAKEAIEQTQHIDILRFRAETLANIATQFADAAMKSQAREAADNAFAAATSLTGGLRSFLLATRIKPALEKTDSSDNLTRALSVAIDDALHIQETDQRAGGIAWLVPWSASQQGESQAVALASKAIDAAQATEDADLKIDVLSLLADQTARAHLKVAGQITQQALALAPKHTSDRGKSVDLAQIADAYAEMGELRLARVAADRCSVSTDKLGGYESIIKRRVLTLRPALAKYF
jgi:hypothetical protein